MTKTESMAWLGMMEEQQAPRAIAYWCVAGHDIVASELENETETVMMDRGARVRICREHGAPIAWKESPGKPSHAG